MKLSYIHNHLIGLREDGADVIGIYPLFENGTCRLLVFDFDNHKDKDAVKNDYANENDEWKDEVNALRLICKQSGIPSIVERSRSGRGAHVWIFFSEPIPAKKARLFGTLLLEHGAASINLTSFTFYDRMYPSQDTSEGIGNLVALPLQGQALKIGNSAFVDADWNAYSDQWNALFHTDRLNEMQVNEFIQRYVVNPDHPIYRPKPWNRKEPFHKADVTGKLHMVLSNGIYVDSLNIAPRLQNQIRSLAVLDNPIYYKNKSAGRSNYDQFSTLYLGKDIEGYIQIPRGQLELLMDKCNGADI